MNLFIREEYTEIKNHDTDEERRFYLGDGGVYETRFDDKGKLFLFLQKEHGRCVSRVYIDPHREVGWVFQKLVRYTDSKEKYLQEVWVTVHTDEPTRTIEFHYA